MKLKIALEILIISTLFTLTFTLAVLFVIKGQYLDAIDVASTFTAGMFGYLGGRFIERRQSVYEKNT